MQFARGRCPRCAKQAADAAKSAARAAAKQRTQFKKTLLPVRCGDVFGDWTVTADEARVGKYYVAQVRCTCGATSAVPVDNLHKGASKGCRTCAVRKSAAKRKAYYDYADVCPDDDLRRRLLGRIGACINRCHNPNDAGYESYGARGVHVFEPWQTDRKAFLAYLMTLPRVEQAATLELDREHVDKGYEPGNLRFITRRENMLNKRKVNTMSQRILELEKELAALKQATGV